MRERGLSKLTKTFNLNTSGHECRFDSSSRPAWMSSLDMSCGSSHVRRSHWCSGVYVVRDAPFVCVVQWRRRHRRPRTKYSNTRCCDIRLTTIVTHMYLSEHYKYCNLKRLELVTDKHTCRDIPCHHISEAVLAATWSPRLLHWSSTYRGKVWEIAGVDDRFCNEFLFICYLIC